MKHVFLLLIAVKAMNGFGFAPNMPFHMQFEIPAFPAMSAMPMPLGFPPIFNPMEATQGETVDPEARGIDGPMGNVTVKNKTEVKDGFKITTISRDGPGFHSYIKEYEKDGNGTTNGTKGLDMTKMMGGNLLAMMQSLRAAALDKKKKEKKCGKCGKGKFCDPIFHLCRKKFAEGRTCMFQKQCGKSLRCQWGKCQKAKAGDPGTFCKGNSQCNGESCCRNTPGSFHLMCIPRQSEGAICGLKKESFSDVLYVVKRSVAPQCSPCESGLKCADTGDAKYKRCVKLNYVDVAVDEKADNPSNAVSDDDEIGEDGKPDLSGPAKPDLNGPPKPKKPDGHDMSDLQQGPTKGDKNEDQGDKEEDDKEDGKEASKEEKEEKGKDDKDDEEDQTIQPGTGEEQSIPIKTDPKKKKKAGKAGNKTKRKDKSN